MSSIRITGAQRFVLVYHTVQRVKYALEEGDQNLAASYLNDIEEVCKEYLGGSDPRNDGGGY